MLKERVPRHLHTDLILMIFGRTEMIKDASKGKFCWESFGEIHFECSF